jgi:small acid-soluble spore protein I (minor)
MDLSLRQAILLKIHGKSSAELIEVIEDSVDGDEKALPGLGVLFEIIWKHSDAKLQQKLADTLKEHLVH